MQRCKNAIDQRCVNTLIRHARSRVFQEGGVVVVLPDGLDRSNTTILGSRARTTPAFGVVPATVRRASFSRSFSSSSSTSTSLRRLASPFLLLCHPDKFANVPEARDTNLKAVQTLNELIDACERLRVGGGGGGGVVGSEVRSRYAIEFVVPSSSSTSTTSSAMCTRREVVLTFGANDRAVAADDPRRVVRRARRQIERLTRAAGLTPPRVDDDDDADADAEAFDEGDALLDETGLRRRRHHVDSSSSSSSSSSKVETKRRRDRWEASKQRYYRSLDLRERRARKEKLLRRLEADFAMANMTTEAEKRTIIANLISRVRFDPGSDGDDDVVDPLEQVMAMRRISLLFSDFFSKEMFERHGRIWERLVIVLTRDERHSLAERKRRRRRGGGESGFKFTLMSGNDDDGGGGGDSDYVVARVPIDFLDDEILHEFEQSLKDLHVYDDVYDHFHLLFH